MLNVVALTGMSGASETVSVREHSRIGKNPINLSLLGQNVCMKLTGLIKANGWTL
jgi:hypothetical protein